MGTRIRMDTKYADYFSKCGTLQQLVLPPEHIMDLQTNGNNNASHNNSQCGTDEKKSNEQDDIKKISIFYQASPKCYDELHPNETDIFSPILSSDKTEFQLNLNSAFDDALQYKSPFAVEGSTDVKKHSLFTFPDTICDGDESDESDGGIMPSMLFF